MSNDQFNSLSADIATLRHMVIALAFASPKLENVVAEFERQQEVADTALLIAPTSDQYNEMVRAKMKELHDVLAAQL